MKEYGGYIELDDFTGDMLYEDGIALNCGRNALEYLCEAKQIQKLYIPYFLCSSVKDVCEKKNIQYEHYHVTERLEPEFNRTIKDNEWIYIVNYYGQLSNTKIIEWKEKYHRVIVDNAQSYFQPPVEQVDTLYTCRKFFGVADGAILYTDTFLTRDLPQDESFERMHFLMGRYERTASEFYQEYVDNNDLFLNEPLKKMSKLTRNILHGIDYGFIKKIRTKNFIYLHKRFQDINKLQLNVPEGAFMYPLYIEEGASIRKQLLEKKIYIPTLWPEVIKVCGDKELECDMAMNILPLPVDQRYAETEMEYIYMEVMKCITN